MHRYVVEMMTAPPHSRQLPAFSPYIDYVVFNEVLVATSYVNKVPEVFVCVSQRLPMLLLWIGVITKVLVAIILHSALHPMLTNISFI